MSGVMMVAGEISAYMGMRRSELHQESVRQGWHDDAYQMLIAYAHEHYEWTTELLRRFAEDAGLDSAVNASAWGSVILRARREKLIEFAGYESSSNPSRHLAPVRIWRRVRS